MAPGNGRAWYLAPSLIALGNEINARWPRRDDDSDGAIGDASHQARKSDHNPDYSAGGVVRAIDIDNDGINVQELLDATIGDQRVWYVIWDHHIYSRTYGWKKQAYDGTDPHTGHVHISINHTKAAESDTSPWFTQEDEMTPAQMTELKKYIDQREQAYSFWLDMRAAQRDVLLAQAGGNPKVIEVAEAKFQEAYAAWQADQKAGNQ
jgi:hypothetical protein